MPEASYQHRAATTASIPHIWARLQDPRTWATVAGVDGTSDHAFDDDLLTGFRFTTSIAGVSYRGTARVTESRPKEAMTLSIRSTELTGIITIALMADNSGSNLEVTMTMRPAGILGSMVFPAVTAAVSGGFEDSVERLAAEIG